MGLSVFLDERGPLNNTPNKNNEDSIDEKNISARSGIFDDDSSLILGVFFSPMICGFLTNKSGLFKFNSLKYWCDC